MRRQIGRSFLKARGWRVTGTAPAPTDTAIFVGAPHTTKFDTALMLAVAWSHDLRIKFLIKKEMLRGPMGPFLRGAGAIPVDRENPGPLVKQLIELAKQDEGFQLVLTPEGTRKKVDYWKSGFYRLSLGSGIPMVLVSPDGPTKVVTFAPAFHPTGDIAADMDHIRAFFADKGGVDPSKRTEPRLRAEDDPEAAAELLAAAESDRD